MRAFSRLAVLLWLAALCGCRSQPAPVATHSVTVAAAADLQFALEDAMAAFHAEHPELTVKGVYGSSGNFYGQLVNRAPFDVFLSADVSYPRKLAERGLVDAKSIFLYGVGRLAVWTPKDSPLKVESDGLKALLAAHKIAIANPEHAPYGRAAMAAIEHAGLRAQLEPKLVRGDNISQAAEFVETGAADAGIIALSLTFAPKMADKGHTWIVPTDSYPRLEQGGVVLPWASDPAAAQAFADWLMGPKGVDLLKRYGFGRTEG